MIDASSNETKIKNFQFFCIILRIWYERMLLVGESVSSIRPYLCRIQDCGDDALRKKFSEKCWIINGFESWMHHLQKNEIETFEKVQHNNWWPLLRPVLQTTDISLIFDSQNLGLEHVRLYKTQDFSEVWWEIR